MRGVNRATWLVFLVVGCFTMADRVYGFEEAGANLVGLWGNEQILGTLAHGELTVDARSAEWRAQIAGFDMRVDRSGGEIRFALPDGQGDFRGRLSKDSKTIMGHWIQSNRGLFNQRYATPMKLLSVGTSIWRGEARPLEERISFYVSIQRMADGVLKAMIRNPEFGWLSRGTWRVEIKNEAVTLFNGPNDENKLSGTYDAKMDRLSLSLLDGSSPLALTRRTEANAVGFYPRTPRQEPASYLYRQPIPTNDGWTTTSLQDVGIDPKPISALMQSLLAADPNDERFMAIHSLLIARHGKLVLEEYFRGFDRERPHDTRSAGKTFAPMLVGVAHDHDAKVGPDTPVYSLFPDYKPFTNWDERKNEITLEHLMTMTTGLATDDNDDSSPGSEDQMQSQSEQPDWYKYTLNLPMARAPGGTTAIYSSASLNLVGGAAQRASGIWNAELFDQYIARPLQFGLYHLNLTPTGAVYTGGGAYLRPRDSLKLGQLYLAGGKWNGRRVISQQWVEQSTAYHATFIQPVLDIDVNHQYGYGWHIHHFTVGGHVYREYAAEGNGGQFVMVVPDLDMVVAVNGGSYRNINVWYRWGLEVLPQYLIPAGARKP
jgi:CubicO group peptidase (beta-lactamase class C family)